MTKEKRKYGLSTLGLHVGQEEPDPATGSEQYPFIKHHPMSSKIQITPRIFLP